jgi:hypothetical protein
MTAILGILFFIAGVGLIILGKTDRNGKPKAFLRGNDTLEAVYAVTCVASIALGVVLMLSGTGG